MSCCLQSMKSMYFKHDTSSVFDDLLAHRPVRLKVKTDLSKLTLNRTYSKVFEARSVSLLYVQSLIWTVICLPRGHLEFFSLFKRIGHQFKQTSPNSVPCRSFHLPRFLLPSSSSYHLILGWPLMTIPLLVPVQYHLPIYGHHWPFGL